MLHPANDKKSIIIGDTGRALSTRKKAHMASVRLGKTDTSAFAEHG